MGQERENVRLIPRFPPHGTFLVWYSTRVRPASPGSRYAVNQSGFGCDISAALRGGD